VAKRGALAIYFANADQWHICIGTESAAHFLQCGPNGEKAAPAASVPAAVGDLLKSASTRSAEMIAAMIKRLPPEDPITDGRQIKLKADAVLDGLIFKLETR
jgi:hypothetical protein